MHGDVCSPAPCHGGTITCTSGAPLCLDDGPLADDVSCGSNLVCQGGACACSPGASWVWSDGPLGCDGATEVVASRGVVELPATGQTSCYDAQGSEVDCQPTGAGQDGALHAGALVNYGSTDSVAWLNSLGFTGVLGIDYWTSTTSVPNPAAAWSMVLWDGTMFGDTMLSPKTAGLAVWMVRDIP